MTNDEMFHNKSILRFYSWLISPTCLTYPKS